MKERLHFEITISASTNKVYDTMLAEKSYREWTSVFNPTSHFKGSWKKGEKILFLGTDQKGNLSGMTSRILENLPNISLSIEHYGIVKDGAEITSGPEVESWAGSLENYMFKNVSGKTLLVVEFDSNEEFKSYFDEMWPKALNKLKEICESN